MKEIIVPSLSAVKVWDSLVRNVVTASVPSAPAVPSAPPSTLKSLIESLNPSLVTEMVTGKLDLVEFNPPLFNAPVNDILPDDIPLCLPLLFVTLLLSKSKFVTLPPAVEIVISELPIAAF